jgi:hypothetical protein
MVRKAFLLFASLLAAGPLLADAYRPGPGDTITADATGLHLSAPDGSAGRDLPFGTPFHVVMRTLVEIVGHEVYVAFPGECPDGPLVKDGKTVTHLWAGTACIFR